MKNYIDYKTLNAPAKIIKNGGIVVFPTETVYGIGTNGLDKNAVQKLFNVKQRPLNKPISLLISNMEMVDKIAKDITALEYKLMDTFFPGPFTIILNKKDVVSDIVTAGSTTVGIRMTNCDITQKLIDLAGVPIAAPSANISGSPSGTNIDTIMNNFGNKVDFYIDAGDSKLGIASTIVKVIDNIPHVLRIGSISVEDILRVTGNVIVDC